MIDNRAAWSAHMARIRGERDRPRPSCVIRAVLCIILALVVLMLLGAAYEAGYATGREDERRLHEEDRQQPAPALDLGQVVKAIKRTDGR